MDLTLAQLQGIAPRAGSRAASFLPYLNSTMDSFKIRHLFDRQMFLTTILHESNDLRTLEENMNYGAEGLVKTWPTRFTPKTAAVYARNPEKIANYVYANRGGNGNEASGDGWRYRGAGLIQLTFKANQLACARYFGKRIEDMPAWLRTNEGASLSAGWYWMSRGISHNAIVDDFDGVCDLVNLGRKTSAHGDAIGFIARLGLLRHVRTIVKE